MSLHQNVEDNRLILYQHGQQSTAGLTENAPIKAANAGIQHLAIKRMQQWKLRRMVARSDAPDGLGPYKVMKIIIIAIFY
jgi:hypothetical protein